MNQRVLSSSSLVLKGITLKSSDWGDASAVSAAGADNPRMTHTTSNTSISSAKSNPPRTMSMGSSQSSFQRSSSNSSFKQFDLQRLSSSSLANMASNGLASKPSAMGNASWDSIGVTMPSSLNMFDLKISEPKTPSSNPFLDGTYEQASRRSSSRTQRTSLSNNLLTLKEDIRCSFRDEKNDGYLLTRTSSKRSSNELSVDDEYDEFVVSTFKEKVLKQIDTRYLSMADLDALKHEDVFMYYSIPAVRKAAFEGKDVDIQDVHDSRPVKRASAISFESADLPVGLDYETLDDLDITGLGEGYYHANVDEEVEDLFISIFD